MSRLARQHRDLPAMVSVVRDQITKESGYIGAKTLDPSIAFEGGLEDFAKCSTACVESFLCLGRRDREPVELLGNFSFCRL